MVKPVVAAIDMGYGHLRPAAALADHLATEVVQMDAPLLGTRRDRAFWTGIRKFYEPLTRMSQVGAAAGPMRAILNTVTAIPPPLPERDLSGPTQGTRWMSSAARAGVGRALARYLRESGAPLLATFYAAAVLAEMHGAERLHCVIPDTDVNRVWAPPDSKRTSILYFAPADSARRRMESYGVPRSRIRVTGYPLPPELVGRDRAALKRNFRARMERIARKGEAPLIVFAVGGAGAQVPLAKTLISGMEKQIRDGALRLALVGGVRKEVASTLSAAPAELGLRGHAGAELPYDPDVFS